ncbi:MAG: lactate utilization protein [Algicola sp.]|nr:lactate utilization protein [Algicola sp.]
MTNLSARNNILAKLKRQVAGTDYNNLPKESGFDYPKLSHQQQLEQFVAHLQNNHAQVIKTSRAQIAEVVGRELKSLNIDKLLYGKNSQYSEEIEALPTADMKCRVILQPFDFVVEGEAKQNLFDNTPAAITGSHSAIAATGTIVLWPTVDEPRTLSLVPPVHFVIVDANQLYADFTTLINEQQWHNKMPTNILLISGPSKTADIQQTLAYGAHGPKKLVVLLLDC